MLEALRQPLEDKVITITRVSGALQFPAHFILLAAQNPCPCGYWGDIKKACICTEQQRQRYIRKVSGPLLDRIDLHVRVYPVKHEKLFGESTAERSVDVLARVSAARSLQRARFGTDSVLLNCDMDHRAIKKFCKYDTATIDMLLAAAKRMSLSARALFKVMKISRTIADLAGRDKIEESDVMEALQYRQGNGNEQ